jgi:hypothetical protein
MYYKIKGVEKIKMSSAPLPLCTTMQFINGLKYFLKKLSQEK